MLRYYLKTPLLKTEFAFFIKNLKSDHSLASYWLENTKSNFKENARTFSKNSKTQENIRISKLKEEWQTYTKKKISN